VNRPVHLLDLFCCEGGAARGYQQAGFVVTGVDIDPQPGYVGDYFHQADAMVFDLAGFDVIHASPPCQSYTNMSNRYGSDAPRLIAAVRDRLLSAGAPYVIENVVGARSELRNPLLLTGEMFGLRVHRPRLFESNVLLLSPPPVRRQVDPVAVYGRREDRRRLWTRADGSELRAASLAEAREAMGMPWASWNGCREAIPPAYAEHLGRQLYAAVERVA
jgi:DNA (cytosine-5)-methyltransferase 1